MDFDKFPYLRAQKAARGCEWQPPAALSCEACKKLSSGVRAPMRDVINLMAFGPSMSSAEYSDSSIEVMTARLVAAQALFRAASKRKVLVYGQRCERLTISFMGPAQLRCVAPFGQRLIDAAELADDKLTLSPVNMKDWLCLEAVAAKPELWAQPDDWRYADNVRYYDVAVDCVSLSTWIGEVLQTGARYKAWKRDLILKCAEEIGRRRLDGLSVQERNTLIIAKACELNDKKITFDVKTIRNALRRR